MTHLQKRVKTKQCSKLQRGLRLPSHLADRNLRLDPFRNLGDCRIQWEFQTNSKRLAGRNTPTIDFTWKHLWEIIKWRHLRRKNQLRNYFKHVKFPPFQSLRRALCQCKITPPTFPQSKSAKRNQAILQGLIPTRCHSRPLNKRKQRIRLWRNRHLRVVSKNDL